MFRRVSKSTDETRLPDAELDVLSLLTRLGSATARELRDAIAVYRPMAHGSVLTLLGRLEAKGLVEKEPAGSGKAFLYRATKQGRDAHRPVVRKLLDRVFGGNSVSLVATLLEAQPPSAEELDEIRELLDEARRQRAEGKTK